MTDIIKIFDSCDLTISNVSSIWQFFQSYFFDRTISFCKTSKIVVSFFARKRLGQSIQLVERLGSDLVHALGLSDLLREIIVLSFDY